MVFDLASFGESAARLTVALLLGCAIGFERQWHQKMAGLRINALVAFGACGFVVFSGLVGQGDPTRVTAQAVMARRNDAALEQIVGRLSLEPQVSGATWQVDRSIAEA